MTGILAGSPTTMMVWKTAAVFAGPMELAQIDLTDYGLYRQGFPHQVFTTLRREAPVWRHPQTEMLRQADVPSFWVISHHDDLRTVNRGQGSFAGKASVASNCSPGTLHSLAASTTRLAAS